MQVQRIINLIRLSVLLMPIVALALVMRWNATVWRDAPNRTRLALWVISISLFVTGVSLAAIQIYLNRMSRG
jgi:hypothetical protein